MDNVTRQTILQGLSKDKIEALRDICEQNGITEDQLVNSPDSITSIEMFLFNYPKMACLEFFPNLRSLMLTQQTISKIENMDSCVHLESAWLNENAIEKVEGLEKCLNLRQLFLYSNRIRRIENLDHLTNLEVLWLSDNQISVIEGLESLPLLRELNLARNQIERVGSSLLASSNLTSLNLSHNRIGLFSEILHLSALPKLQDLCLADPMFGDCPVAQLCNYQTFVLYHLPRLQTLDTLQLNDEAKQVAEATFTKKRMYYNMRMKTVRRNSSNLRKRAQGGLNAVLRDYSVSIGALSGSIHDLRRWLQEGAAQLTGPEKDAANAKVDALQALLDRQNREVQALRDHFQQRLLAVERLAEELVRRMFVELDSGGNVRYEDGKPGDAWYGSCVDLIASRFAASDFPSTSGVQSVRVTGVTRIHNRFLRHRFENTIDVASRKGGEASASGASARRPVEYLFFGDHPALSGELRKAAEEGFRHVSEYAALGLDCAVPLHTSLGSADGFRFLDASQKDNGRPRFGSVLVCKVYLGSCSQEATSSARTGRISKEQYAGADSVVRSRGPEGKNRTYYVFNHAMVLPEYLIHFEYGVQGGNIAEDILLKRLQAAGLTDPTAVFEGMDPDSRGMAQPLGPYLALAASSQSESGTPNISRPSSAASFKSSGANSSAVDVDLNVPVWFQLTPSQVTDPRVAAALRQGPTAPALEKLYEINADTITRVTGQDPAAVTSLCLHRAGLGKVEGLHSLARNLKELVLSFNDLTSIETLVDLPHLTSLDLSFNSIRRIDGLNGMTALRTLLLSHNRIFHQDDLAVLRKLVPNLSTLDLSWNPITSQKNYRLTAIRRLPQLQRLDCIAVDERESRMGAADVSTTITPQLIQSCSTAARGFSIVEGPGWEAQVQEVRIEHRHVRRITGLVGLPNIRALSLHDNEIARIEGLEDLASLEELSLDDNRILEIEGLDRLRNLSRLDLGRNQISMISGLDSLSQLTQLSLEDNQIRSLVGLSHLSQLMELYLGNNDIEELREVFGLRELPRLIILDLMGNPVCQHDDYRLYVIYHLRKLRVLDGKAIDAVEQAQAKNRYAGRLTLDFLEDRVGHRYFDRIRELDISGLRIRDVGSVFMGDSFSNLRSLTMDANLMTDVWGLRKLRHLNVLRMNDNRLGEASFEPPPDVLNELMLGMQLDDGGEGVNPLVKGRPPASLAPSHPFRSLQALFLNGNQISSIAGLRLHGLTSLRVLHLANNEIAKLDGLESLVHLRELNLDKNKLKSIDPGTLHGPTYLQFLSLEENAIRSVDGLVQCHALQVVRLGFNRLADVARLDALAVLPRLVELTVNNNPITRKPMYRPVILKRLQVLRLLDGREVTAEEREQVEMMFPPQDGPLGPAGPIGTALQQEARGGVGAVGSQQRGPIRLNMMQLDLMGVAAPRDVNYASADRGGLDIVGTRAFGQVDAVPSSVSMAPRARQAPAVGSGYGMQQGGGGAGGVQNSNSSTRDRWSAQRNQALWNLK